MPEQLEHGETSDARMNKQWHALLEERGPIERTTMKGIELSVESERRGTSIVYTARLPDCETVAEVVVAPLAHGRARVLDANVYEVHDTDYRRRGIGTAMYDLIEEDIHAAGGDGLEPNWGALSSEAVEFWAHRRPELREELAAHGLPQEYGNE